VRQIVRQKGLAWSSHRIEEAHHDLYVEGLQVWQETQNAKLARGRMYDRRKNVFRDAISEDKHKPKAEADFQPIHVPSLEEGETDVLSFLEQKAAVPGEPTRQQIDETDDVLNVRRVLAKVPSRVEKVCRYVMAEAKTAEIARALKISPRTVERDKQTFKKEYVNAYGIPKRFRRRRK